jgi:hypothetical protein
MSTAAATGGASASARRRLRKSPFFTLLGMLLLMLAVAGFWPQYFSAVTGRAPAATTQFWLIHLHAALFTTWLLLYVSQAALIMSGRARVHLKMGPWLAAYLRLRHRRARALRGRFARAPFRPAGRRLRSGRSVRLLPGHRHGLFRRLPRRGRGVPEASPPAQTGDVPGHLLNRHCRAGPAGRPDRVRKRLRLAAAQPRAAADRDRLRHFRLPQGLSDHGGRAGRPLRPAERRAFRRQRGLAAGRTSADRSLPLAGRLTKLLRALTDPKGRFQSTRRCEECSGTAIHQAPERLARECTVTVIP